MHERKARARTSRKKNVRAAGSIRSLDAQTVGRLYDSAKEKRRSVVLGLISRHAHAARTAQISRRFERTIKQEDEKMHL